MVEEDEIVTALPDGPSRAVLRGVFRGWRLPATLLVLWMLVFAAVPIAASFGPSGWDLNVYRRAIDSLRAGHDPYIDSMAAQRAYFGQARHAADDPPFGFVYPPVTLPILRAAGALPAWLSSSMYWLLSIAGALAEIWVALLAVEERERSFFLYLAPITIFFPGLLANGIFLGVNVAYILYGAVLLAAVIGWRRERWGWFYLAVLVASCVKAPMLSLVAIPLFSARKQWVPAMATAGAGVALFACSAMAWPVLFAHQMEAVDLQVRLFRDFGSSPAGLFSTMLLDHGRFSPALSMLCYLAYAVPVFLVLRALSQRYFAGEFSFTQWMPVLLVGVLLLNPRLIEYDLAVVTLPLALIAWRSLASMGTPRRASVWLAVALVAMNGAALASWTMWKFTEGPLLVACFVAGTTGLLKEARVVEIEELWESV